MSEGKYDESLAYCQMALDIQERSYKDNRNHSPYAYMEIGRAFELNGKYVDSIESYQKALAINLKNSGEEDPLNASIYYYLGSVFRSRREYDQALENMYKALDICLKSFGDNHIRTAMCYVSLGSVYQEKGDVDMTIALYEQGIAIEKDELGDKYSHETYGVSLSLVSDCPFYPLEKRRNFSKTSLRLLLRTKGSRHPRTTRRMRLHHDLRYRGEMELNNGSCKIPPVDFLSLVKSGKMKFSAFEVDVDFLLSSIPLMPAEELNERKLVVLRSGEKKRILKVEGEVCISEYVRETAATQNKVKWEIVIHYMLGLFPIFPRVKGISVTESHYLMFTEFMENQSLEHAFQMNLPKFLRLRMCLEICEGIRAMHSLGLVHCDIHLGNILLTKDFHVKICDFEFAITVGSENGKLDEQFKDKVYAGASLYAAPELFQYEMGILEGKECDIDFRKCDVWSIGAVLVSVLTGKHIYASHGIKSSLKFDEEAQQMKLSQAEVIPPEVKDIEDSNLQANIRKMLTWDSKMRPELEDICVRLNLLFSQQGHAFEEVLECCTKNITLQSFILDEKEELNFEEIGFFTFGETGLTYLGCEKYFVKKYCLERDYDESLELARRIVRECEILAFAKLNSLDNLLQLEKLVFNSSEKSVWVITTKLETNAQESKDLIQQSESLTAQLIRGMCLGLQSLHNSGFLHRDLKLDNVMVTFDETKKRLTKVVLIDFGYSINVVGRQVLSTPFSSLEGCGVSVQAQTMNDLNSLHEMIKDILPEDSVIDSLIPESGDSYNLAELAEIMKIYISQDNTE
jgi:serine/threonine protein kinase/tetratricopeptide (TPR) repeat protein